MLKELRGTPCVMDQKNSVGHGWHGILKRLDKKLKYVTITTNGVPLRVLQVKEKFGALRVYTNKDTDKSVVKLIDDASDESMGTCEICGDTNKVETKSQRDEDFGWVKTLCATHHYERDEMGKIINFGI